MTWPQISAIVKPITQRYTLADIRAANGVNGAIGMEPNRRLMPRAASVAARNAPEMEANEIAWSTISGVRNCA